ncbi:hypothetical protein BH609_00075 [Pseudomonas aeruginosa]|nr:hypothetical protein BH609_00075 [Pseudomonas aeruginosa]
MSWRSESPFTAGFRAYVGFWFHCSPNPDYEIPEVCYLDFSGAKVMADATFRDENNGTRPSL